MDRARPKPSHDVNGLTPTPQIQPTQQSNSFINYIEQSRTMAQPIPQALTDLVALNVEFNVLICIQCKFALKPTTVARHLADRHKTPIKVRQEAEEYVKEFSFTYDYTTITLPSDRSAPQPIIPIIDRYKYKGCVYKT